MPNKYLAAFPIHALAQISDLLAENGELYINLHSLRGGGTYDRYFIRSLRDLKTLILEYDRDLVLEVHRASPIVLRGIADKDFLEHALQEFRQHEQEFYLFHFAYYPDQAYFVENGTTHEALLNAMAGEWGQPIAIGTWQSLAPVAYNSRAFEVDLRVSFRTKPQAPTVYAPYDANPARYQWIVEMWRE